MSGKLPAGLRMYRLLSAAVGPFTPILLARRVKRGKEHRQRLPERRGENRIKRPEGPLVWLHGASVGELASVLPLIDRIRARGISMLVTTGTVTSGGLAEQRLPREVIHQFIPLDIPRFVRRFLDHWRPDLALFVESELWPNMMIEASARGIPMVLVNARLSENSFDRWRRLPNSIAALLQRLDLCLAGTSSDAARLSELGAANVVTTGNLKLDAPAPPADPAALAMLQDAIAGRPLIAAASTHAGEEGVVIEAHARLQNEFSGPADDDCAAPSGTRPGHRGDRRCCWLNGSAALARGTAQTHNPDLCRGHRWRTGPDLSAGIRSVYRRLIGQTRRAKSGRGGQAAHRNPAWSACLEFRRDLCGARQGSWRRTD